MSVGMVSLEDLMESLKDAAEGKQKKTIPIMEAQVEVLRDRFNAYNQKPKVPLRPGDFVQEKQGLGLIKDAEHRALMLWHVMDFSDPADAAMVPAWAERVASTRINCLVAVMADGGGDTLLLPHDLARLEPVQEKAKPAAKRKGRP